LILSNQHLYKTTKKQIVWENSDKVEEQASAEETAHEVAVLAQDQIVSKEKIIENRTSNADPSKNTKQSATSVENPVFFHSNHAVEAQSTAKTALFRTTIDPALLPQESHKPNSKN